MVEKYSEKLGGEQVVRDEIEAAQNHTASDKWKDAQIGIQRWLNNVWPRPASTNGQLPDRSAYEDVERRFS